VTPSILANLRSLMELSHKHGVDMKPTLLRVLTDLYIQQPTHTPNEDHHFSEIFAQLFDAVDVATRSIVAAKLASYPAVPVTVLPLLASHRRAVLGQAPSAAPAQSLSQRPPVGPAPTAHAHVADFGDRFFVADSAERSLMLRNVRYSDAIRVQRKLPADIAGAVNELETAALGGKPVEFIRALERALGLSRSIAQRIVNDPSGEPLVVAAKALAMPIDVLQRILLFVNPAIGHSVRRVYDLSALYDDISPEVARHVVSLWCRPDTPATSEHRSYYWDDEGRAARSFASPRHAERPQIASERKGSAIKRR
jgi:hypothetical protein